MRRTRPYITRRPNFRNPDGSSSLPASIQVVSFSETSDSAAEFTLRATFNTSTGGAYWYVGTSAPSDVAALKAGTGSVDFGSLTLTAGVESSAISLSGLTLNDDLTIYMFAENTAESKETGTREGTSWTVGIPPTLTVSSTTANTNGTQIDLTWTASAGTVYAAAYTTQADPDKATLKGGTGAAATDSDAHTVGASALSSLDDHTTYHVYAIAEKANGLDSGVQYLGTVTTPDVTAPTIDTWTVGTETTTVAPISYALTEDGPGNTTIYWVAVPTDESAPSDDQVIAGTNASDTTPAAAGNFTYNADGTFDVTLPAGQGLAYDIHGVAVDAVGNKSSVSSVEATLVDAVAPNVTTFTENAKASTTIDYNIEADEDSTAYIALYTSAQSPVPTGSAVETQSSTLGASEAVLADTSEVKQVTGLTAGEQYFAYVTFKDPAGNHSAVSGPVTTTTDTVSGYTYVTNFDTSNNNAWYISGVSDVLGSGASVVATLKYVGVKLSYTNTTQAILADGAADGWKLRIASRDFSFLFDENSGTLRQALSTTDVWNSGLALNEVFVVHVVLDGTNAIIYLDGTSIASEGYDGGISASTRDFCVGHSPGSNLSGSSSILQPPVDVGHIAFSWRTGTALTPAQVASDASATSPSNLHLASATFAARPDPNDATALIVDVGSDTFSFNTTDSNDPPTLGTVAP